MRYFETSYTLTIEDIYGWGDKINYYIGPRRDFERGKGQPGKQVMVNSDDFMEVKPFEPNDITKTWWKPKLMLNCHNKLYGTYRSDKNVNGLNQFFWRPNEIVDEPARA